MDEKNGGRLLPKGNQTAVVPTADGKWTLDGTFTCGRCVQNTVRAHHIDAGLYGGAGVSTSRSLDIAIRFATNDYFEEGYVYVIDECLLEGAGVNAKELPNPREPKEQEVTLIEKSGGALPAEIVIEKYSVSADGLREQI